MKRFVPFLLASILMIGLIGYSINGYQKLPKIDSEQVDTALLEYLCKMVEPAYP